MLDLYSSCDRSDDSGCGLCLSGGFRNRRFGFPSGIRNGDGDGSVGSHRAAVGKLQDDVWPDCHLADRPACAAGDSDENCWGLHWDGRHTDFVFALYRLSRGGCAGDDSGSADRYYSRQSLRGGRI